MLRLLFIISCLVGSVAHAEEGGSGTPGFGMSLGIGLPYITQVGAEMRFGSMWGVSATYNSIDLDIDEASIKVTMPEILVFVHPFSGSYFIGAGIGKESLEATATDSTGTAEAKIEVDATTTIIKTGWKWGLADGGFWFGMDLSYIMPSSPDKTITAPGVPTTDPNYQDALDSADKFGETSYFNITLARFGWMF